MPKTMLAALGSTVRSHPRTLALVGAAALLLVSAAPIAAQDEANTDSAMDMEGLSIGVSGVEYAYVGLPTSVPAGTTLTFTNNGAEVHEMILVHFADGVTETVDDLLAMDAEGRDPLAEGLIEMVGDAPLFAGPGETAEGSLSLEAEGRYLVICFVPQGLSDMGLMEQLMTASGPEDLPEEVAAQAAALMEATPHYQLGMVQEFTVTAAGTEVGPLPAEEPTA